MWKELVEFAREKGLDMPYKSKQAKWVIELGGKTGATLKGPYDRRNELRRINAPDRTRSGSVSSTNLKPYLLFDDARYVLGLAEPGKEDVAKLAHQGFKTVLREAADETGDRDLQSALSFLERPLPKDFRGIQPRDWLTFQAANGEFLCEREAVQEFWMGYLGQELSGRETTECTSCGKECKPVRILPRDVVVMGQKTQVASFNLAPFYSRGKEQMANAPLCYECATGAVEAIDYLAGKPKHRAILIQQGRGEGARPLANQLAIFWLKQPEVVQTEDAQVDVLDVLAAILHEGRREGADAFAADIAMVEALVRAPWSGTEASTIVPLNAFYLAILSANKGRLAIRDWLELSLGRLRQAIDAYLRATRIVDAEGKAPRAFSIPGMVQGLEMYDVAWRRGLHAVSPNLVRGLVRTAYLGHPPPSELLSHAVQRFRFSVMNATSPQKQRQRDREIQAQAAALKLWLAYNDGSRLMETDELDKNNKVPAYLCGRLLAILEEAQQRAANFKLRTTLVDRYYPAACSAPAMTFGVLLKQATSAHMPKIGRNARGYAALEEAMEEVLASLDEQGGFPKTLVMREQADFALGFYFQRGWFRAHRGSSRAPTPVAPVATASTPGGDK